MFVTLLEAWNHIRHLPLCRHIFFVEAQLEKSSKGRSEFSCSISEYKSGDTVWSRGFVDIKLLKLLSHLLWPKDDFLAFGGGPLREMRYRFTVFSLRNGGFVAEKRSKALCFLLSCDEGLTPRLQNWDFGFATFIHQSICSPPTRFESTM